MTCLRTLGVLLLDPVFIVLNHTVFQVSHIGNFNPTYYSGGIS